MQDIICCGPIEAARGGDHPEHDRLEQFTSVKSLLSRNPSTFDSDTERDLSGVMNWAP